MIEQLYDSTTMSLSTESIERFKKWYNERNIMRCCLPKQEAPAHTISTFQVTHSVSDIKNKISVIDPKNGMVLVVTQCSNCANVRFYRADVIFPELKGQKS